jgi:hypothetical protein
MGEASIRGYGRYGLSHGLVDQESLGKHGQEIRRRFLSLTEAMAPYRIKELAAILL